MAKRLPKKSTKEHVKVQLDAEARIGCNPVPESWPAVFLTMCQCNCNVVVPSVSPVPKILGTAQGHQGPC